MAFHQLTAYATTVVVSFLMTACLVRWQDRLGLFDLPNARSSHSRPKPRTGGIAIFTAWILGSLATGGFAAAGGFVLLAGAMCFFLLGLADDLWRLPEWSRLLLQIAFSLGLAAAGLRIGVIELAKPLSFFLTVFWLCGFVNIFNFMDGIDGIAAWQVVVAGIFIWLFTGGPLPLVAAAAAGGFLFFNSSPACIFMGDAGSYFLGYLLAAFAVQGSRRAPFWAFVLIFAPFIFDTSLTLARRIWTGEQWFRAHRSHYYQKLVMRGWSHAQVCWLYSALSVVLGFAGLACVHSGR